MSGARRRVVAVWAGLCLTGAVATLALEGGPHPAASEAPTGEPTPAGTRAVDCEEIADHIEQDRAEAERARREALDPSASPDGTFTMTHKVFAVPRECAETLGERGPRD
ncbi:hypothetical protein ABZ023_08840 [Streptomyces sp. NPDC006367]|uniref:hypothetical protein n=1 Tax=unclassified Streptomyces TaxID=2593676 RepID=UPI0033B30684